MSDSVTLEARGLPDAPLDASAEFAQRQIPAAREARGDVIVLFDRADHSHSSWRKAAVQELAREASPRRVNAIAGGDDTTISTVIGFLQRAPGVTGQLLEVAEASA